MTTATLADRVGITRTNMSNIVNGKNDPSIPTLEKIFSVLDLFIPELFDRLPNDVICCPYCGDKIKVSKG